MPRPKSPDERTPGDVIFHPAQPAEYNIPQQFGGGQLAAGHLGFRPAYKQYLCGACGSTTTGRVLCDMIRKTDLATVSWCLCSCDKTEPTIIIEKDGQVLTQLPLVNEFPAGKNWPADLRDLYEEAAKAYCAGAFTAASMVCRKILMACACEEGDGEGKSFAQYVDHITTKVLTFPRATAAIDAIRSIGNDANHKVTFVAQADARRSLEIITYMLNAVYALPSA